MKKYFFEVYQDGPSNYQAAIVGQDGCGVQIYGSKSLGKSKLLFRFEIDSSMKKDIFEMIVDKDEANVGYVPNEIKAPVFCDLSVKQDVSDLAPLTPELQERQESAIKRAGCALASSIDELVMRDLANSPNVPKKGFV